MSVRALALVLLFAAPACADEAPKIILPAGFTTQESTIGQTITYGDPRQYSGASITKSPGAPVLADFKGMTVYVSDSKAACVDACVRDWQPVAAPLTAIALMSPHGDWSILRRADGSPQWAYKGRALYTFVKDVKAGDTKGDGLNGQWHAARP